MKLGGNKRLNECKSLLREDRRVNHSIDNSAGPWRSERGDRVCYSLASTGAPSNIRMLLATITHKHRCCEPVVLLCCPFEKSFAVCCEQAPELFRELAFH